MSRQLKIVLAVLAALVLVGALALVGFVWWLKANLPELQEQASAAIAAGEQFAAERPQRACLPEALARLGECDGLRCELGIKFFLQGCLDAATASPGLCDGVPGPDEIAGSIKYRLAACLDAPAALREACSRVVPAVQEHCHPRGR